MKADLIANDELMTVSRKGRIVFVHDAKSGKEKIKFECDTEADAIERFNKTVYDLTKEWGFEPVKASQKTVAAALIGQVASKKPQIGLPRFVKGLQE
jgi:hypothetical protein